MEKIPLYYTFGNHMHWVDMQWLWGYHVLPGSIRDMLHFCRETGAKGNVNFDGIGYEKLAAEDPESLAELREAVQNGTIEPVGCSYGQPYGLFHGGESNLRQRIYGARTVRRLLGMWPKTFWEEEFDFFPQLPQMLKGCGFDYASLFFQWTWHTPEIPKEEVPVIWWEGQDGSRLLCATRNKLNLHQWPEDMDATFADLASNPPTSGTGPTPLILQWLELMPSPDWMCRSEVLLPKMRELLADERFEIRMATLGEYLNAVGRGMGVPPMVSSDVSSESELITRQGAYLPHWTKDGGTYAVTFRLDDALPAHVQQQYAEERDVLQKMHDEGRLKSTALAYELLRLRTEKVEGALDAGHGSCLLRDPQCAEIVANALRHFDGDRYHLISYVVMPNHVHVILAPAVEHDLATILHSWKSFTAHSINKLLDRTGALWQPEYYDHLIRSEQDLANQIDYILQNPEKAGLSDWPWVYRATIPSGRPGQGTDEEFGIAAHAEAAHDRDGHGNHGRDAHATPTRKYTMDDAWHGMSLGKNTDNIRRESFHAESTLLVAESLAATLSLFGRPYAQWDVYPTWELEEQWRNLLMAQHHDNDECEGLCGHVGKAQYKMALTETSSLIERLTDRVAIDFDDAGDVIWIYNPLGWSRLWHVVHKDREMTVVDLPALGWTTVPLDAPSVDCGAWAVEGRIARFRRGFLKVDVDLDNVSVIHFANEDFPEGIPLDGKPLWEWCGSDSDGNPLVLKGRDKLWDSDLDAPNLVGDRWLRLPVEFANHPDFGFTIAFGCEPHHEGLEIRIDGTPPRPKSGLNDAFGFTLSIAQKWAQLVSDEPYGVSTKEPSGTFLKKYPEGDWMTSPQWFETIERPFTASTFVDLQDSQSGAGLQVSHDGVRQWFLMPDGAVRHILHAYDPWDEERDYDRLDNSFRFLPHLAQSKSQLWRQAQESHRNCHEEALETPGSALPSIFSALSCDSSNVLPTAFYRETEDFSGKHVENYAGQGMGYPFVVRLVEFDGLETEATLTVAGTVAKAYKTNHLGQILEEITDNLKVKMRPYEIATIYLDIVEGRKQTRDLDAKREIWATVHRVE